MVVVDRAYAGAAASTIINTAMTAIVPGVGGTITVADDSGYPASGKFEIVVDRGLTNEESILISSRSGTTFTIGQRGYDGTVASAHTAGQATCEHELSGRSVQLFVDHVDDVESDPHSAKLLNNARHDIEARHQFGAALGSPATPADIATAAAVGSGNNPSKEDHAHKIGTGAINASGMFAAGVVDAAAIGANAVGSSELADNAVDTNAIQAAAVTGPKLGDTLTMTVFTSSGTWTKPAGLRYVRVRLVGGGGSGGGVGATSATEAAEGGGGGGGGYAEEVIAAASLGATEAVTVGAGGAAATAGDNPGNAGGSSSFGAHCSATGGAAGSGGTPTTTFRFEAGGAGGAGSGGGINMPGANGGTGMCTNQLPTCNTSGGESMLSASAHPVENSTGQSGRNYGGGSSGAVNGFSQGAKASQAGAGGIVIVEEYA